MNLKLSLALLVFGMISACASAPKNPAPCTDLKVQADRSAQLQKIKDLDQADREWFKDLSKGTEPSKNILEKMAQNDLERRVQVGAIFGEGCFKTVADYKAAFIVFQHGNTPDQFFQAFIWAKRALDLGDQNAKSDMAMAIDRYLVSIQHKELFGTQASQPKLNGCWCIEPTEETFPQAMREEYRGGVNAPFTGLEYLYKLNATKNCLPVFCETKLAPSPRGTVIGFW